MYTNFGNQAEYEESSLVITPDVGAAPVGDIAGTLFPAPYSVGAGRMATRRLSFSNSGSKEPDGFPRAIYVRNGRICTAVCWVASRRWTVSFPVPHFHLVMGFAAQHDKSVSDLLEKSKLLVNKEKCYRNNSLPGSDRGNRGESRQTPPGPIGVVRLTKPPCCAWFLRSGHSIISNSDAHLVPRERDNKSSRHRTYAAKNGAKNELPTLPDPCQVVRGRRRTVASRPGCHL